MGLAHNPSLPDHRSLIHVVDAGNPKHTTGSGNISDGLKDIVWTRGTVVTDVIDSGIAAFDSTGGYFETTATGLFGQYYTVFYLIKPGPDIGTLRTFHRNSADHVMIIATASDLLGFWDNRTGGGFRSSGYAILEEWQVLIITGEGSAADTSTGTQTYYVNDVNVGTSDRVACGTDLYRIGWTNQHPGFIATAGVYNKLLSTDELTNLYEFLKNRMP